MSHRFDNDKYRFGSSQAASEEEMEAAGFFDFAEDAVYCGKAYGRRLWFKSPGGILLCAGARSGKLTDFLAQNVCHGVLTHSTLLILDPKGELAAISQDQTPDEKFCLYWNPFGLHGLPKHRLNPFGHLTWSSERLFSDIKFAMRGMLPASGAAQARYFELNARRIAEVIALTLVKTRGVLTFPDLYDTILSLAEGGQRWLDFAFEMHTSGIRECVTVEAEIANAQDDSSGGYRGILGELQAAMSCLSDPVLREALSPPFDARLEDLCSTEQAYQLYLMCPVEVIEDWAPVLKSILSTAKVLKSRHPQSPRQTWILDEAARLQGFEEVVQLFSDGAGVGIRPIIVLQEITQAADLGRNAVRKISSSAAMQIYFGVRDPDTAKRVSEMIGAETLSYDDPLHQGRARVKLWDAIRAAFAGEDVLENSLQLNQTRYETDHLSKQHRMTLTQDEVMRMARDKFVAFADGLSGFIDGERRRCLEQEWMAGRYQANPHHPPLDKVLVQTRRGPRWRPIIAQKVPDRYSHYPQYAGGTWSIVKN